MLVFILNFLDQIQTGKNAYTLFTKGIEALSHMDAGRSLTSVVILLFLFAFFFCISIADNITDSERKASVKVYTICHVVCFVDILLMKV